jgi:predicted DNA-binding transcriptional regulator AlpA
MDTNKRTDIATQPQGTQMLNEMDAAKLLCLSHRTLQKWRVQGGGPRFKRYSGRCIRYQMSNIQDWLASKTYANTSEQSAE